MNPVLIDANSLIVRHVMVSAMDDLRAGGIFTGGVYGSLRCLRSILIRRDVEAGPIFAFFDNGVPPRRLELLPEYKSERKGRHRFDAETRERLFQQMHPARMSLEALGVECLAYRDREADDCVAAAARHLALPWTGDEPIVVSSDRDLFQCVAFGVYVWDLANDRMLTPENFKAEIGVDPRLFILWKALVGDPSDSIPGVPGIGAKRATLLLDGLESTLSGPYTRLDFVSLVGEVAQFIRSSLVEEGDSLPAWAQAVAAHEEYLKTVVEAIDLRNSFGSTRGLVRRLDSPSGSVDRAEFNRLCIDLDFDTYLADPDFITPFTVAERRRNSANRPT